MITKMLKIQKNVKNNMHYQFHELFILVYLNNYPKEEKQKIINKIKKKIKFVNGKAIEMFRYYKGIPDGIGRKKRF